MHRLDVAVVGAGAAGIGMALALQKVPGLRFGVLFFGVRFEAVAQLRGGVRVIGLILLANYLFVPAIGYGIASALLATQPLFMIGLMIYFMSPCTDWFLGFTRLARGNAALGTALIPINMVAQLLLGYPEHALLTMNIAARNAPLMLAVTMAALPGQPLVYAALVIGMLVEFPHLTVLQRVLLSQRQRATLSLQPSVEHS
ncbi:hypothetical protein CAL29_23700 [Bordetella genomosp. 10]|uniref:Arsenic resistance protein n=1 Tax=Bordetella genomosp. 10 TaxID=1416804 RepID=A0A261S1Z8_9BORD|nr:hypothetical protein [Bordetella genomosp. 10]OZI30962.1 hypothetical protein CAL29_23700 [Bordetella genomosp. 10]